MTEKKKSGNHSKELRKQAEKELRESENKFRSIIENSLDGIYLIDGQGLIIEWNPGIEKITLLTKKQVIGKPIWDFYYNYMPDERKTPAAREQLQASVLQLSKRKFSAFALQELLIQLPDGTLKFIQSNAFSMTLNDKIVYATIVRDITGRKVADKQIRESEERYRTILESCAEGILVAEIESYRFKYANPAMCSMLGYTKKELLRRRLPDIHPKEILEEVKKHFSELARGLKINVDVIACRRRDGSVIYADIVGTKLFFDGKECLQGFFTDITERRAVEKKLLESEALFRQTFENAPIGILIFNRAGAVMKANSFLTNMLGYSEASLKARFLDAYLHEEDRAKSIQALLSNPDKLRRPAIAEKRYVARGGHTVYVKECVQGIFNNSDELVFVIVLIEDITSLMQTETLNINIIAKLKDVYNELHAFSAMLPSGQKFSQLNSIHDFKLSPMENRVASMIYHSYSNKKIASLLSISENTVKHHVTSIFSKLKVRNRIEFLKNIREQQIII